MILLTLPYSELEVPPCGPAVLKGIAQESGYNIQIIDTNIMLLQNYCDNNMDQYNITSDHWLGLDKFPKVRTFYQSIYNELCNQDFTYLGISVFSVYTHIATYEFLNYIKDLPRDWEIVVGGKGLTTSPFEGFAQYDRGMLFWQILQAENLYNKVILGDAEDAIIDLLSGNYTDPFVKNTPVDNLLSYPYSNFDDYSLNKYSVYGKTQLPVYVSKGCVRACDFCDVAVQFGKFQQKDPQHLANEMIYLAEKYGVYDFASADSIANGNMRSINEFAAILAEHNSQVSLDKQITWNANWIARPRVRSSAYGPDFYKKLKASGCTSLTVGAEAVSDHVLLHMNKKTDVDGLIYELEQLSRVGIQTVLNMIVGHWSERYDDFLEQLRGFIKFGPIIASKNITDINLSAFSILNDTPSSRNQLLEYPEKNFTQIHWHPDNTELTYTEKMARLYCLIKFFVDYGIPFNRNRITERIVNQVNADMQHALEFFANKPASSVPSVALMSNIIEYANTIVEQEYSSTHIHLQLEGHNNPDVKVMWNDKELYTGRWGILDFDVDYDYTIMQQLSIQLINKTEYDVELDSAGNIVKDKYVTFASIKLDNVDIVNDMGYLTNCSVYTEDNLLTDTNRKGLWLNNSKLVVEFNAPFWRHYLQNYRQPLPGIDQFKQKVLDLTLTDISV